MKTALRFAISLVIGFAITFAFVAYLETTIDPFAWPRDMRGIQALLGIGVGLMIAAAGTRE